MENSEQLNMSQVAWYFSKKHSKYQDQDHCVLSLILQMLNPLLTPLHDCTDHLNLKFILLSFSKDFINMPYKLSIYRCEWYRWRSMPMDLKIMGTLSIQCFVCQGQVSTIYWTLKEKGFRSTEISTKSYTRICRNLQAMSSHASVKNSRIEIFIEHPQQMPFKYGIIWHFITLN